MCIHSPQVEESRPGLIRLSPDGNTVAAHFQCTTLLGVGSPYEKMCDRPATYIYKGYSVCLNCLRQARKDTPIG